MKVFISKITKFIQNNKKMFASISSVIAALGSGLGAMTGFFIEKKHEVEEKKEVIKEKEEVVKEKEEVVKETIEASEKFKDEVNNAELWMSNELYKKYLDSFGNGANVKEFGTSFHKISWLNSLIDGSGIFNKSKFDLKYNASSAQKEILEKYIQDAKDLYTSTSK